MLVKRAYVYTRPAIGQHPIRYIDQISLGWRVGLIDIHREGRDWKLVHVPSNILIACVKDFVSAKALARLFMTYGVSTKTTIEEIKTDPLWSNMQKAYRKWYHG